MVARPPRRFVVSTGFAALALGVLAPVVSPAAALADPKSDPPGNNGTIKIDPYGATDGHGNHPHPGCDFRLQLFGFDDDQTGTITFVGQAPTRDAVSKQPLAGSQQLSNDKAGGGKDVDAFFDVRGADLGLTGAPAKQGYHVKVLVNADNAPGGAKTKVFWLDCPAPPKAAPATSDTTEGTTTTAAPATSTSTSTSSTDRTSSTTAVQGQSSGAATAATTAATGTTAATATRADTELLGTSRAGAVRGAAAGSTLGAAAVESPDTRSSGRTGAPGGGLPFTGLPAAALAGLGLSVLALGGLAVAAGRRRTTSPVVED